MDLDLVKGTLIGELEKLSGEVRAVAEPLSEPQFWTRPLELSNSVGHLVLHLSGNLDHFVGAQLGKTGYVRNREHEFTTVSPPSKAEALDGLDAAVATFRRVVAALDAGQLAAPHPEARFGTVYNALVHLLVHFAVHRGQMSYIVRLLK